MPEYKAPLREMKFIADELLDFPAHYANLPVYADVATPDMVDAIITEGAKFCENVLAPINRGGDIEGCTRNEDASVTTPTGFKEAYRQYVDNGWASLSSDVEYGGQGLPESLGTIVSEMVGTANWSWGMYPGLSHGAKNTLEAWGTEDTREEITTVASTYNPDHGFTEEEAHHVHKVHYIGAVVSIIIAFSGVFIAFMMYIRKSWNPGWWVTTFSGWYRAMQNKYYMDDLYIKGVIQKGLIPLNNFLAWLDMGIYDRFIVDGWATVNRGLYTFSKWFDDLWVDTVAVDGTGASVRLFNVVLRTLQSGKIQFYFIMIIVVLAGYVLAL